MTIFLVLASSLTCGFFVYVLVKFDKERKQLSAPEKLFDASFFQIEMDLENPESKRIEVGRYA